jgi:ferredoxin
VEREGVYSFQPIADPAILCLRHGPTRLPPKKYLLPPRQTTLHYRPERGYELPESSGGTVILLGLQLCDLSAVAYLDRIFLQPEEDPLYSDLRRRLVLGGVSCQASEGCCCNEAAPWPPACDFFMDECDDGYRLFATSAAGTALLQQAGFSLSLTEPGTLPRPAAGAVPLPAADPACYDASPLWQEFAGRCVGCGACSACCPTCFCFGVTEEPHLDGKVAERRRSWDNCLFPGHGRVAGGLSFRSSLEERLRYRFRHKYYGLGPHRGSSSCVGCGRCRAVCPVDIDLCRILAETGP